VRSNTGVDRVAFSAVDIQARRWWSKSCARGWPRGIPDRAGNSARARDPKAAKAILVGSHTEQRAQGRMARRSQTGGDLRAGSRAPRRLSPERPPQFGVDVLFRSRTEEGTFLSCFGSRIFCRRYRSLGDRGGKIQGRNAAASGTRCRCERGTASSHRPGAASLLPGGSH